MAQICVWLVAGVMLGSVLACSLGLDMPCSHGLEKGEIFSLLVQLKSIPPYLCLNDRFDFQFPWKRGNITEMQKTQCTCLRYLMLQQIFNLFTKENIPAAWNGAILTQLLSGLHQRMSTLEPTKEGTLVCPQDLGILVRKYFFRIHNYLKEKKYSSCAWEVVRTEIQAAFLSSQSNAQRKVNKRRRKLHS